ncbi:hypothetical protein AGMMS49546_27780 [Spirochaetia bacterium]|nr:hypothetical protein AGMMS49546_27780 [Spirochaetia bacterium]
MKTKISLIDTEIALAIGICLLLAMVIPQFQIMTACIAVLLCVQNGIKDNIKAGLIRIVITLIGGFVGIAVILADNYFLNPVLFIVMVMIGVLLTLFCCKLAGVPAFNARIGGVTFILVVLAKTGSDRIDYALFRLLSTVYGVAAVVLVTGVFSLFTGRNNKSL